VAELIAVLSELPPDAIPGYTVDYGDYTHTQTFLPIMQVELLQPGEEYLDETRYSDSGLCIRRREEEDRGDPEETPPVEGGPVYVKLS